MKTVYERNIGALSLPQQRTLFHRSVLIVGCGGIGARVAELLLRAGIQTLTLCDPARFSEADFNRHPFASDKSPSRYKATETKRQLLRMDPQASVCTVKRPFNPSLVHGHDLILDCTDQPQSHRTVAACNTVPVLHAKAYGYLVTLYRQMPNETRILEAYPDPRPVRHPSGKLGVLDAFAASLLVAEAVLLLKQEELPSVCGAETPHELPYSFFTEDPFK